MTARHEYGTAAQDAAGFTAGPAVPHDKANPAYYRVFGPLVETEAIDIIKNCLTPEEYVGYLKGNLLKYKLRGGDKGDPDGDRIKAARYKEMLTKFLLEQRKP